MTWAVPADKRRIGWHAKPGRQRIGIGKQVGHVAGIRRGAWPEQASTRARHEVPQGDGAPPRPSLRPGSVTCNPDATGAPQSCTLDPP
jgi:hypothetical protein